MDDAIGDLGAGSGEPFFAAPPSPSAPPLAPPPADLWMTITSWITSNVPVTVGIGCGLLACVLVCVAISCCVCRQMEAQQRQQRQGPDAHRRALQQEQVDVRIERRGSSKGGGGDSSRVRCASVQGVSARCHAPNQQQHPRSNSTAAGFGVDGHALVPPTCASHRGVAAAAAQPPSGLAQRPPELVPPPVPEPVPDATYEQRVPSQRVPSYKEQAPTDVHVPHTPVQQAEPPRMPAFKRNSLPSFKR